MQNSQKIMAWKRTSPKFRNWLYFEKFSRNNGAIWFGVGSLFGLFEIATKSKWILFLFPRYNTILVNIQDVLPEQLTLPLLWTEKERKLLKGTSLEGYSDIS